MDKNGALVIIDDDAEDLELYKDIIAEIGVVNELKMFTTAQDALEYLRTSAKPFIILSDVNLPKMDGFELP